MVLVVAADKAEPVAALLRAEGETVTDIGVIEPEQGRPIRYDGTLDLSAA
jgi:phosphoribosylaminoimidazole (AIR) synthetase